MIVTNVDLDSETENDVDEIPTEDEIKNLNNVKKTTGSLFTDGNATVALFIHCSSW